MGNSKSLTFTLSYLSILFISCSPMREGFCDNTKTEKYFVYKNPQKFYPQFANDWEMALKSTVDILNRIDTAKGIKAGGDLSMKRKVVQLREKLNQENIYMENLMKSAFIAYNTSPCDPTTKHRYFSILETMTKNSNIMKELKNSLTDESKGLGTDKKEVVTNPEVINASIDNFLKKFSFSNG